jgi:endonuclease YncB( thermonuclease family)
MGWNPFTIKQEKGSEEWNLPSKNLPPVVRDYVEFPLTAARLKNNELWIQTTEALTKHWGVVGIISMTSFAIGFKAGRFQNPWRRFTSITDIPSQYFGNTAPYLRGRVLSVSDGDTIRFRHTPSLVFQSSTLQQGEKLSEMALPIRICTIDTPETAKFGKEGQPFGDEAREYLRTMIENKIVHCQLLQTDQYGRAVAQIKFGVVPFWQSYVDEKMLQAGLAEVYQGGGAVYGRRDKNFYLELMERAKSQKKGMWSQGDKGESAAEYKARLNASKQ